MRYVGGKHHQGAMIGRQIRLAAHGRTRYVEPFVGGGNVLIHVPATLDRYAYDIHPDLIAMWQAVADGWHPPTKINERTYQNLKLAPPSALRGFVGFASSYGGKWFAGYGRGANVTDGTARWFETHRDQITGVHFAVSDYRDVPVDADTVVYADPPYDGTTEYPGVPPFDSTAFWRHAQTWVDAGAAVLVSEYQAPKGWLPVRVRSRYNALSLHQRTSHATEMLYRSPQERSSRSFTQ